ncbi:replication fork protection component Swi3-domain-containing protein [Powellomyces hirtus]|nr:replication fork protection component Swi3-domain-containing protein [Powellomyces hirtus]
MLSNENREGSAVTSPQAESQDRSARRTTVKLDADKLLSTPGLPRLRHESSKLRFKGKGHEAADLQKLMTYYQIWGHGLFPKLKFESFVEKTESVCRQKRMKIFLDAVLAEERRRRYNNGASADEEYEMKIEDKDRIRDGMDYDEPPDGKISEDATQVSVSISCSMAIVLLVRRMFSIVFASGLSYYSDPGAVPIEYRGQFQSHSPIRLLFHNQCGRTG